MTPERRVPHSFSRVRGKILRRVPRGRPGVWGGGTARAPRIRAPRPGRSPSRQTPRCAGPSGPLAAPFVARLNGVLASRFPGLTPGAVDPHFARAEGKRGAAVESRLLVAREGTEASAPLRRVRITEFGVPKAGVRAFTAACFPGWGSDAPIFGVEVLTLPGGGDSKGSGGGRGGSGLRRRHAALQVRHLVVFDVQPLRQDPAYLAAHTGAAQRIRGSPAYAGLWTPFESKFYDANRFFSPAVFLARASQGDEDVVTGALYNAFSEYLDVYAERLTGGSSGIGAARCDNEEVMRLHAEYDEYNLERDPAAGLFRAYMGAEWTEAYLRDFLFPLANPRSGGHGLRHEG